MPSFDIVSELELFEVNHAVQNTQKEIATRFDFRGHDAVSYTHLTLPTTNLG
ncbi:DUF520 family protein, partial [Acinetobacter baumannii]